MIAKKKISKKSAKKKAKKVVKKTAVKAIKTSKVKKVAVKKRTKKKTSKKILITATGDRCFWVNYGPPVKDLFELFDILSVINEEQFRHHVNEFKNDFAEWVEYVLEDKETAGKIKKTKTASAMAKVVGNSLKGYRR